MNKTQYKIFLSSHQKEFGKERKALKAYIEGDVLLRKFFDIFIFEASPAVDSTSQELYHKEVEASTIYIGLLGDRYGAQNFILTVQSEVVRKRFESIAELIAEVYSSLIAFLESMGKLGNVPFDKAFCDGATWDDIDSDKVETFLEKAKNARKFAISSANPKEKVLKQMNLAYENRLTNSAILLFGKAPQRFFISSEVKCLHFHGKNVAKPIPSYQIYKGSLFELADQALDFVMSKLNRNIGTREKSNDVAVNYEIPAAILSEAIINAIAHRDYTSNGSIQVMVFSDRVEIWNPGYLPPNMTIADLFSEHSSIPANPLIAESLFLAHYIEKVGSGTVDIIRICKEVGLSLPKFQIQGGNFVFIVYRPSIEAQVEAQVDCNETEIKILEFLKEENLSSAQLVNKLGLKSLSDGLKQALKHLLEMQRIELTIPDKPKSSNQKYKMRKRND